MILDLAATIINDKHLLIDWKESCIVNLYECKDNAFKRGNNHSLNLIEHVIKFWWLVSLDESYFDFVPGRSTTADIFVVQELNVKHLTIKENLYITFVDLGKALVQVTRKLGVDEWIVCLVC